ncbi:MAG: DnaJ domain-containing protein, partial [Desulfamplus sp.]|nr:DnaJ domain-containing protein [Desulfamplus sp.]
MNVGTSFKILELTKHPDMADVKKAYRIMAKKFHPDRFDHDPVLRKRAESKMKEINLAFRTACDFINSLKKSTTEEMDKASRSSFAFSNSASFKKDQFDSDTSDSYKSDFNKYDQYSSESTNSDTDRSQRTQYDSAFTKTRNSALSFLSWCWNVISSGFDNSSGYSGSSADKQFSCDPTSGEPLHKNRASQHSCSETSTSSSEKSANMSAKNMSAKNRKSSSKTSRSAETPGGSKKNQHLNNEELNDEHLSFDEMLRKSSESLRDGFMKSGDKSHSEEFDLKDGKTRSGDKRGFWGSVKSKS